MIKRLAPVISVIIIAVIFRFFLLTSYPVSLQLDEINIGYNAYSILKTGKDEWGEAFPLAFKSYGDFKAPVNVYLTSASIFVFGLTEFAVRLPSALFGALSVPIFILLLKELGVSKRAYIFGGLWLSVLPWHVHYSRGGFEAVTSLFLTLAGVFAFYRSINTVASQKTSYTYFLVSVVSFALSVWAYHSNRVFVPLLFIFLLYTHRRQVRKLVDTKKRLALGLAILAVLGLPFAYLMFFTPAITTRALSTSILRDPGLIPNLHNGNYASMGELVFDNDIYLIFRHWLGKYLNYFDLRLWFWKGLQLTPSELPGIGLLYLVDLPLILFGMYRTVFSKNKRLRDLAIFWFFAGPFAASLAMNEQHPLRAMVWIPFFGIVATVGFDSFIKSVRGNWLKIVSLGYAAALTFNIIYFGDIYLRQFPRFFSEFWQYGYEELSLFVCDNHDKYDEIFITDTYGTEGPVNTGVPYVYYLFYCRVDPASFVANGRNIPKVSVKRPDWKLDSTRQSALLVGTPFDFPEKEVLGNLLLRQIDYLNGSPAFYIVEIK